MFQKMYDALGQRVRRTVETVWSDSLRDLSGNVITEFNNACGTPPCWVAGYMYLGGQLVAEYTNSTTYFAHSDHLGSARLVTDLNKNIVENLDYLPFGEINSTDSASPPSNLPAWSATPKPPSTTPGSANTLPSSPAGPPPTPPVSPPSTPPTPNPGTATLTLPTTS